MWKFHSSNFPATISCFMALCPRRHSKGRSSSWWSGYWNNGPRAIRISPGISRWKEKGQSLGFWYHWRSLTPGKWPHRVLTCHSTLQGRLEPGQWQPVMRTAPCPTAQCVSVILSITQISSQSSWNGLEGQGHWASPQGGPIKSIFLCVLLMLISFTGWGWVPKLSLLGAVLIPLVT